LTKVNIEMQGLDVLLGKLKQLGLAGDDVVQEVIVDLATDTHANAVTAIQGGPKTGRTYRRGNVVHQASAAGQAPASDTGRLVGGVKMILGERQAQVGTNVVYGPMLEFGTSNMAARPWLLPAFEKAKIGVERELKLRLEGKL
jgi:phage gpG-like protein